MKSKQQKQIEAEVRQEEYDALTLYEKLQRALERPGRSTREQRRIWKQIDALPEL